MYAEDSTGNWEEDDEERSLEDDGSDASVYSSDSEDSRDELKEIEKIIQKETDYVAVWREIVTGMVVITAALVIITTYIFLSREEVADFAIGFDEIGESVVGAVGYRLQTLKESSSALSMTLTSNALASGATWPLFKMSDFEVHAENLGHTNGVKATWTSPLVTDATRNIWTLYSRITLPSAYPDIYEVDENLSFQQAPIRPLHAPIWQVDPSIANTTLGEPTVLVNFDMLSDDEVYNVSVAVEERHRAVLASNHGLHLIREYYGLNAEEPISLLLQPVFQSLEEDSSQENSQKPAVVAYLNTLLSWTSFFGEMNACEYPLHAVVENTCGDLFTLEVVGDDAFFVGHGDQHEELYSEHEITGSFEAFGNHIEDLCSYTFRLYPTAELRQSYKNKRPQVSAAVVGVVFLLMGVTFWTYDKFVQRRNDKVIQAAARTNRVVSSLFPSNIRDRILGEQADKSKKVRWMAPKVGLKSFLRDGADKDVLYQTKPIAELFPNCTVIFMDLVGFTAWSSVREPSQVFTLLETVYRSFDQIAKQTRIYKVETVGDCYVAASGVPDPRRDHAVAMGKFAHACLKRVKILFRKMEVTLGPDTGDLSVRIGIHSGPVTAGVLRGDRARFQLFGDTMNTAARMESTGMPDRIQLSQETADLLTLAGKSHWLRPRTDKVVAKGKGEMQTFWLEVQSASDRTGETSDAGGSAVPSESGDLLDEDPALPSTPDAVTRLTDRLMSDKTKRLIDWNVDVLLRLLKSIVARRAASLDGDKKKSTTTLTPIQTRDGHLCLDELKEIIALPAFDAKAAKKAVDPDDVVLDKNVIIQLHDLVTNLALLYRDNPFHNFEHASHVTMSVTKLLSRIVAPSELFEDVDDGQKRKKNFASDLHDHTYGITSDPLTQFACVFSALIHDADHRGVPNSQLIKEDEGMGKYYRGKSVAEQNSVDLSWDLLMDDRYKDLLSTICCNDTELKRFRELVVSAVLATDIMDKDLKALRNARWDKAFKEGYNKKDSETSADATNRKATIVIEHLIQASDVAHTMQHWHIYRKWNERFFTECYQAYRDGRAEKDPTEGWYKGEMGFFDFYIIPLAKKLKDCGVFGVSSDEYLNYAERNRQEWESRGQEVVEEMKNKIEQRMLRNNNKSLSSSTHPRPEASRK